MASAKCAHPNPRTHKGATLPGTFAGWRLQKQLRLLIHGLWDEIILDGLDGPSLNTRILKNGELSLAMVRERCDNQQRVRDVRYYFSRWGEGDELGWGGAWVKESRWPLKLEKARKQIVPSSLQKET